MKKGEKERGKERTKKNREKKIDGRKEWSREGGK